MATAKSKRTCPQGHVYFKSSVCPVCPVCAAALKQDDFRNGMSAPARRALASAGITTLTELATWTKQDLLKLHGFGPASIPKLEAALVAAGRVFRP